MTSAIAHAATKDLVADPPALVAAAAVEGSVPVAPHLATPQPATSAGTFESLPDLPPVQTTAISFRPVPGATTQVALRPSRISFGRPHSRGVSPLASMPLAGAARHLGAQRFNTDDGSMLDDFAICYRMSGRSSIEVIPGDPAPVKLPVVSMANNTGITVGMVFRLSK